MPYTTRKDTAPALGVFLVWKHVGYLPHTKNSATFPALCVLLIPGVVRVHFARDFTALAVKRGGMRHHRLRIPPIFVANLLAA